MGERGDLRRRTMQFALRIIRLYKDLQADPVAQVIGRQFLRSGTSVGAHYREAFRSRSDAEYVSKIESGSQELEETAYWIDLPAEAGIVQADCVADLRQEMDELMAIFVACAKKAKRST